MLSCVLSFLICFCFTHKNFETNLDHLWVIRKKIRFSMFGLQFLKVLSLFEYYSLIFDFALCLRNILERNL